MMDTLRDLFTALQDSEWRALWYGGLLLAVLIFGWIAVTQRIKKWEAEDQENKTREDGKHKT